MPEPPTLPSDYASFEDFGLFAIDHFQKRMGNLSIDGVRR